MSKARIGPSTTARWGSRPSRTGTWRWSLCAAAVISSCVDLAGSAAARAATSTVPIVFVGVARPGGSGHGGQPAAAGSKRHRHRQFRQRSGWQDDRAAARDRTRRRRLGAGVPSAIPADASASPVRGCGARARVSSFRSLMLACREFEAAFAQLRAGGVQGVVMMADPSLIEHAGRIAALAQQARLPTVFQRLVERRCRRPCCMRLRSATHSTMLRACRSHPHGCAARRHPGRAADQVRARDQSADREGARPRGALVPAAARRRGDRMKRRELLHLCPSNRHFLH